MSENMVKEAPESQSQKKYVCSEICISFHRKHDEMEMESCIYLPAFRGIAFCCPLGNVQEGDIFKDLTV